MFHPKGPTFCELAEQALSSTERGYDLLAPKFDYTPFRTPQPILDAVAIQLGSLGPYGAGLDLCCGTGAGMAMLRPLCRERVVGIDISQGMLEVCRRQIATAPGTARLELVRGNVLALPFGPAFDIVVCFGALGHIPRPNQARFLAEAARVLRPGGRFAFVTSYQPSVWSLRHWLSRLFNGAMWLRNWLVTPPFIMYYLTFLLPGVAVELRRLGLEVEAHELGLEGSLAHLHLVIARAKHTDTETQRRQSRNEKAIQGQNPA
jgi:ubiquinone/menaquinone biosynthesis C-methylase UbiE